MIKYAVVVGAIVAVIAFGTGFYSGHKTTIKVMDNVLKRYKKEESDV